MIAGRTCLAGDLFGSYELESELKIGDEVRIADAAGYTMVKKNWFNGVADAFDCGTAAERLGRTDAQFWLSRLP